jgi:hypothetical protein
LFEHSAKFPQKPDPSVILSSPEITRLSRAAKREWLEMAFSDLPMERRLVRVPEGLTSERIALMANLVLAKAFVGRSSEVEISAEGEVRRIVRQAKLRRLICETVVPNG